jgi:SAM-dependent methyltransferase
MTSIFLAREVRSHVWAVDLWKSPQENMSRVWEAGLVEATEETGVVFPIHAEAHALPFQVDFFDLVLSVDSYHYWGFERGYLDYVLRFLKPGGHIAIVVPGDGREPNTGTFRSALQWQTLWAQTPGVELVLAEMLPGGWELWWRCLEAEEAWGAERLVGDKEELLQNRDLGFSIVVARKERS